MSSESSDTESWISWFCSLPGHEMLCEVDRSYIEDSFNLYGLRPYVRHFKESLDIILDHKQLDTDASQDEYQQNAETLYGLIHARYIITMHGMEAMSQKYDRKEFGECPRTLCSGQAVLPLGTKDEPYQDSIRLFCPKCQEVYNPPSAAAGSSSLDGAYIGSTFPHLFFMTYEDKVPTPATETYSPRVFGFRIHQSSKSLPQPPRSANSQHQRHQSNNTTTENGEGDLRDVGVFTKEGFSGNQGGRGGVGGVGGGGGGVAAAAAAGAATAVKMEASTATSTRTRTRRRAKGGLSSDEDEVEGSKRAAATTSKAASSSSTGTKRRRLAR